MPLETLDLCLYGRNQGISPERLSADLGLTVEFVSRAYAVIDSKRRAAEYLHRSPIVFGSQAGRNRPDDSCEMDLAAGSKRTVRPQHPTLLV